MVNGWEDVSLQNEKIDVGNSLAFGYCYTLRLEDLLIVCISLSLSPLLFSYLQVLVHLVQFGLVYTGLGLVEGKSSVLLNALNRVQTTLCPRYSPCVHTSNVIPKGQPSCNACYMYLYVGCLL